MGFPPGPILATSDWCLHLREKIALTSLSLLRIYVQKSLKEEHMTNSYYILDFRIYFALLYIPVLLKHPTVLLLKVNSTKYVLLSLISMILSTE